ncbi:MAG: nitrate/sulfonate/bicarbonate ABC transporter ATP-binding protein [Rickettsiaceae bacterium]|nr:nitrate/sulfonate/bicarbonate ABC transporter ATP-binding protein [Rickettsiaceae bacterium]
MEKEPVLELKNLTYNYDYQDSQVSLFKDFNIKIKEGEIVGILGRSGSGKSTLLKMMCGLVEPTFGEILYHGRLLSNETSKISMVFQNIGLVPWLNVLDNIGIGLLNKKLSKEALAEKVRESMSLVDIEGYGEAYPKEMSGGMRQRVAIARALAVAPEMLLLDSPFALLDHISTDELIFDLLDLWIERKKIGLKSIVFVTSTIIEAISFCDRIIVMSSNTGGVVADINVNVPHPRDIKSKACQDLIGVIYHKMNFGSENEDVDGSSIKSYPQSLSVRSLEHFIVTLNKKNKDGVVSIKEISDSLRLSHNQLFIFLNSLSLLNFIKIVDQNNIELTSSGQIFAESDAKVRKAIFKEHLVHNVTFVRRTYRKLQDSKSGSISKESLLKNLMEKFPATTAQRIFSATVSWARYAGLFSYNHLNGTIRIHESSNE